MALDILITVVLVLANGFFVATEFAFARLRPTQVEEWVREARPGSRSVQHAVTHIDAYLAACQLGITLASLGLGVIGERALHELLEPVLGDSARIGSIGIASALAFGLITLLHVVVGELSPKSVAIARTERTALMVAPPMRAFYFATRPLVDLFNGMGNLLLKPFGIPPARDVGHAPHSEAELQELVRQSGREGLIEREEQAVAENAFSFDDRRVREIMRPRAEIRELDSEQDLRSAARTIVETGHTRLPLVDGSGLDGAAGVVHAKDVLAAMIADEGRALRDLARPIDRVSESIVLSELLQILKDARTHLALVVDEHGTVIGLVTLEDALEELVGEIADEFDPEGRPPLERDGDALVADGEASLRQISEELGVALAEGHEATIGGLLLERLGRMPEPGERVRLDGLEIEVREASDGRIRSVRIAPGDAQYSREAR